MTSVGISTTVFGDALPGPREWELLSSHGFSDVELAFPPTAIGRSTALGTGLRLVSVSVALSDGVAGIGMASDLGCKLLVVRTGPCRLHGTDPRPAAPDSHAMRRIIEPLAASAHDRQVALAIEFPASWPAEEIARLLESLESAPVGVCLDLGHAHLHEGAPEAIEQLAGYVHIIHLHDNLGRTDDHRIPFAGSIDWPSVMMELEKTGYAGPAVIEVPASPETPDAPAISRLVGARTRLQAILDDLAQPMVFPE